jgi:SOS-response transcriptional repressor LexA
MMTEQMRRAYDFIAEGLKTRGIPPSYQEIADHLGLKSKNGVNRLVVQLEERGLISRLPGQARAIALGADGFKPRPQDQNVRHSLLMIREALNLCERGTIDTDEAVRRIERYAYGKTAA